MQKVYKLSQYVYPDYSFDHFDVCVCFITFITLFLLKKVIFLSLTFFFVQRTLKLVNLKSTSIELKELTYLRILLSSC